MICFSDKQERFSTRSDYEVENTGIVTGAYLMDKDFIEIDSKRIPLSDIKSYEIITEKVKRTGIEKRKRNWFVRIILLFTNPGFVNEPKEVVASSLIPFDVLIIRTIHGEEYRFSKNDYIFDIQEKVRELNDYLNLK